MSPHIVFFLNIAFNSFNAVSSQSNSFDFNLPYTQQSFILLFPLYYFDNQNNRLKNSFDFYFMHRMLCYINQTLTEFMMNPWTQLYAQQ